MAAGLWGDKLTPYRLEWRTLPRAMPGFSIDPKLQRFQKRGGGMNRLGKAMKDETMKSWQTARDMGSTSNNGLSEEVFFFLFCFTSRNEVSSVQWNIQRIKAFTQFSRHFCLSGIHALFLLSQVWPLCHINTNLQMLLIKQSWPISYCHLDQA